MNIDYLHALWGGLLIGLSVTLMLLWNGRVTGISGIVNGALQAVKGDTEWRWFFIGGLIIGGFTMKLLRPESFQNTLEIPLWLVPVAGFLVGFGTVMGSGCTSGHGVCGVSRLSPRSLLATTVFMAAGFISVYLMRVFGVLS